MLVWTDLETTGLEPKCDSVLEVAAIVTDDQLNETARFTRVIYHPISEELAHLTAESTEAEFEDAANGTDIDLIVVKMHARNGLWKASAQSPYLLRTVDEEFAAFLLEHSIKLEPDKETGKMKPVKAQLAGSTISFDRGFMAEELPVALAELHYRNVDVSTLNELGRRFWPDVHARRPKKGDAHRGMADIEESIAVCRYYLAALAPVQDTTAKIVQWAYHRSYDPSDTNAYDDLLTAIQKGAWM